MEAIKKLRRACQLSDTYNMRGVTIYHNTKNVFVHPVMGEEMGLPEVIEIGSKNYKEWMKHKPRFTHLLDFEVPDDWDEYPCLREPVRTK